MKKKDILIPGLLAFSCARGPVQEYITTGPLVDEDARVQLAVYFLPTPSADPIAVLATAVAELDPGLHLVDTNAVRPEIRQMARRMRMDVAENYAPPEEGLIVRSGFGVSAEQARAVQRCREALVMDFAYPRRQM